MSRHQLASILNLLHFSMTGRYFSMTESDIAISSFLDEDPSKVVDRIAVSFLNASKIPIESTINRISQTTNGHILNSIEQLEQIS